jgi:hypothetical protein
VDFAGPLKSMEFTATWPDSSSVLELSLQKGVAITIAIDTSMIRLSFPRDGLMDQETSEEIEVISSSYSH